jgi:serine/threonine-protein kinase
MEDSKVIGRYQVVSRLGAGAMGVVYLAEDPLLKRKVAVKVVQRNRAESDLMVERFQREAKISAQLNHPNIITVFDVGDDPAAGPFLTMEFVDGCSLQARLQQGPPDPETALDWLTQLGLALVAAERAGVVHRDVKAENILVSRDSQLKLTDFGLARDDDSSLTRTGTMMGTPSYTAPELLAGARATPATDRWAYFVVAFQVALGTLPFNGETLSTVLNHIAHDAPEIPEGTAAPLARVFLKALHKDPARRYESILAFLMALATALGIPEKLVTKGLTPSAPARALDPGETEAFEVAAPPPPAPAAASHTSKETQRPQGPPAKAGARLTGPPADLFRGAAPAEPPPEASAERVPERPVPRKPGSQPIGLAQAASSSNPRGWAPTTPSRHPAAASPSLKWLIVAMVVLAGTAGFFFFPRSMEVRTNPPGATVLLDGKEVGPSPFQGTVGFGSHMLEVRLAGYDTVVRPVASGDSPLVLTLQASIAYVDILTDPAGAQVSLDGRSLGSSPILNVHVPDHPVPLRVSLRGYQTWTGNLGPGARPPHSITLKRD